MLRIFITVAFALSSVAAVPQDLSARTVQYHSQDIVPIHAKLKYTTLIQRYRRPHPPCCQPTWDGLG